MEAMGFITENIPETHRVPFAREVAGIQAEMASVRVPQLGRIARLADGSYGVTAIPGLGGLFDTTREHLEAWCRHARFPTSDEQIRVITPQKLLEEML